MLLGDAHGGVMRYCSCCDCCNLYEPCEWIYAGFLGVS